MVIARYTGFAQALHWLTVALLCLLLPFVWVAENFPPGPVRTLWYLLHESTGISVFLLILIRLTWRWRHPAPPANPRDGRLLRLLAGLNHGLLYAVLLLMPVFGLFSLPGFPRHEALGILANRIHVAGQFAVYGLVLLHVAAVVWHVAIRRDGTLERMLPEQRL